MLRIVALLILLGGCGPVIDEHGSAGPGAAERFGEGTPVALGPRPQFLVNDMAPGPLRDELSACFDRAPVRSTFSIGHRGAPLQFAEHTRESYEAAYTMGAGMLECDVTFTRDHELVCRHAQNDLATTTNILLTPLARTCAVPFTPAVLDEHGQVAEPARAECLTSDLTLAEFRTLQGKMDSFDRAAQTPEQFVGGTASFRTELYAANGGTLMTHAESIALFDRLGVAMTPELKSPVVPMPHDGFTQAAYAQKLIDEYREAGIDPSRVFPQSFEIEDIRYWLRAAPEFGRQAVYLDDAGSPDDLPDAATLTAWRAEGIRIVGPPLFALLAAERGRIVPSAYAVAARAAGLDIIAWSLERSGPLGPGRNGFYYQTLDGAISRDGDVMRIVDVLARDVGVRGIFSDWPATVSFYAGCVPDLPGAAGGPRSRSE